MLSHVCKDLMELYQCLKSVETLYNIAYLTAVFLDQGISQQFLMHSEKNSVFEQKKKYNDL